MSDSETVNRPTIHFYTNQWASGEIRAEQVAKCLGPIADVDNFEAPLDDLHIFVKGVPDEKTVARLTNTWIDVVDNYGVVPWLKNHENIGVIGESRISVDWLKKQLPQHRVIWIPEHHCNFERTRVLVHRPQTVGFCGYLDAFHLNPNHLQRYLWERCQLRFIALTDFKVREDVVDFLRQIDINVTFRRDEWDPVVDMDLKNPLKLINAGSFGIPTVGYPEKNYTDEWDGNFIPVRDIVELVEKCDELAKDFELYQKYSNLAIQASEPYHISNILPEYLELQKNVSTNSSTGDAPLRAVHCS